ncbi:MAG: SUMF1/EgtB/PvdO family nonheme iron enzyme [Acidobacteriota bacterium]|nr:SUMF1/EgtB/PvdO family nonheme iron enzyme [Acidobacteriota bacterium]
MMENREAAMNPAVEVLISRLADARERTDELFRILLPSALYERPIPERNRNVFYLGHLEAFDWNLLAGRALNLKSFDPAFDKLFSFGIDPVDGGLPSDQPADWPAVDQVQAYNRRVRQALDAELPSAPASSAGIPLHVLLNTAIEHRLMHAETLAYMFNQLPAKYLAGSPGPQPAAAAPVQRRMTGIPAGEATLGMNGEGTESFGWDNEYKVNRVSVPAFSIDVFSVTNEDFLNFILSGGYQAKELWTEAAWEWISGNGVRHPVFWRKDAGKWLLRTMFSEIPLPFDWPVYVSHSEASAYCRWKGKSLPTEAEWHRAAFSAPGEDERPFPWGDAPPTAARGNFDFARWTPAPVSAHPLGASAFGVMDLLGNGWEWTSTVFSPFPGFKAFPFYPGYSANFFDGKHYVMKGGSARTAACMLRRSFRNWFQPHYPYIYAKFRAVSR